MTPPPPAPLPLPEKITQECLEGEPGAGAAPGCPTCPRYRGRSAPPTRSGVASRCCDATPPPQFLFLACVASTVAQVRRRPSHPCKSSNDCKKKSCDLQFLPFVRFSDVTAESLFAGFSSHLCLMRMMLGFFFSFFFQGFERLDGLIDTIECEIANPRLCFFN